MENTRNIFRAVIATLIGLVGSLANFSMAQYDIGISIHDETIEFSINALPVVVYQMGVMQPPEGIANAYARSGFIHPVKTLAGHRITQIHPADHYHHFGIWNPWTHVLYRGDTLDFWNIARSNATVRFAKVVEMDSSANAPYVKVLHEHIVRNGTSWDVVLNEIQTLRVSVTDKGAYALDIGSEYSCATQSPFTILKYRYGGLGFRGVETWDAANSEILTSTGATRSNADGSSGRWCMIQGDLGDDNGGAVILSCPSNFNHPEPLRVWPPDMHDGHVFVNFAPTKTKDWIMLPGKVYTLKYRIIVFDGMRNGDAADMWWDEFAETER